MAELKEVLKRYETVLPPAGLGFDPVQFWKHIGSMKSAGWLTWFDFFPELTYSGTLGQEQQDAILFVCTTFRNLTRPVLLRTQLPGLKRDAVR